MDIGVAADGLAQFRRDLKKIDPELLAKFREELVRVAGGVAAEVRASIPKASGRAAESVRAGVSGNNAYIAGGKRAVPYYGWLDFGSRQPVTGQPRNVGPWKGSGTGPVRGRYIYPAIHRNIDQVIEGAQKAFDQATNEALKRTYD